jgi:hypothetical protein
MIDLSIVGITSKDVPIYFAAVIGSLGVELGALVRDSASIGGHLPEKYKKFTYPTFRVLFAFFAAGSLAVFLEAPSRISALYMGAAAPLIFDRLAAGIKPNGGSI